MAARKAPVTPTQQALAEQVLKVLSESTLAARAQFAEAAGLTFGTKRDMYRALGYKRRLLVRDYRDRYERGDIAGRVVDVFPDATWRGDTQIIEDDDPAVETQFEKDVQAIDDIHHLWQTFNRADKLAGLGHYSVIVIGAEGSLDSPLTSINGPEGILYLAPFAEDEVAVKTIDADTSSKRFAQPLTYAFMTKSNRTFDLIPALQVGKTTVPIHFSRVIHFVDSPLSNRVYGQPRLKRVWNRLDDLEKVVGSGAEAFWKRSDAGTVFKVDPIMPVTTDGLKEMREQLSEYEHGMRRHLSLRGIDVEQLGSDVANFAAPVGAIVSLISGSTGIPQRLLLGSERGELASTQDRNNWDDRIADRRKMVAEPNLIRPFITRMIELGAVTKPQKFKVWWQTSEKMSETEKSVAADKLADANAKSVASGAGVIILGSEIREHVLGLEQLDPAKIPAPPPAPEPTPAVPAATPVVP